VTPFYETDTVAEVAKMLGLAWFYSSESGLFNGLQRVQINLAPPDALTPNVSNAFPLSFHGPNASQRPNSTNRKLYSLGFRFSQVPSWRLSRSLLVRIFADMSGNEPALECREKRKNAFEDNIRLIVIPGRPKV
jgi:hypothetical protein